MTDATELNEAGIRKAAERSLKGGDWWDPHDLREALDRIADAGDDTRVDAEYIWQVRPAKVLAALDENDRLRAALDEARRERDEMAAEVNDLTADWDQEHALRTAAESVVEAVRALADEWVAATCISDGAPCSFHRHADGYRSDVLAILPAPTSPERSE